MSKGRLSIWLPNLQGGGAERVSVNLANGFIQRGYAVDIVLLSATGEFLPDLHPEIRVVDLQVKRLRSAVLPLMRYLRQTKPTAVLACMWPLTIVALWARTLAQVPTRVLVAEHTTWSRDKIASTSWRRWKVGNSMRYAFPGADGFVTVSNGAADDLARFANLDLKAIAVMHNSITGDTRPRADGPLDPVRWWMRSHRKVLAVGALKLNKNYGTSLHAFARLLIFGGGYCRAVLRAG